MFCSNCGEKILEDYEYCPNCGTKVKGTDSAVENYANPDQSLNQYKVCPVCGAKMPEDAYYCLNCGSLFQTCDNNDTIDDVGQWRNKWVTLVLCILLGWLGVHRFYQGKIVTGILYLFTIGLLGIGWLVDILIIITYPNPYRVK